MGNFELGYILNIKLPSVIALMRSSKEYPRYKHMDYNTLVNLCCRSGDELHCQFTPIEELQLLDYLVTCGKKPVASIVIRNLGTCRMRKNQATITFDSRYDCDKFKITNRCLKHKNRWGCDILLITKQDSIYTDTDLINLSNETISYDEIGRMYGYNK